MTADALHDVDGFVAAVPTARKEEFRLHAAMTAAAFREHGALQVVECWGEDVPEGQVTSFRKAVKQGDDETVIFSWIVWPSKALRDAAMPRVMEYPRCQPPTIPMPFDGQRVILGGFRKLVEL